MKGEGEGEGGGGGEGDRERKGKRIREEKKIYMSFCLYVFYVVVCAFVCHSGGSFFSF